MRAAKEPPTAETIREAQVALDIAMLWASGDRQFADDDDGMPVERRELWRIVELAIGEYLRTYPKARCRGMPWLQVIASGEIDFVCLFCRTSLNTIAAGGGTLPRAFCEKLEKHCLPCACRFLIAGSGEAPGLRKGERVVPLSKLKGRKLRKAATEAAAYLEIPMTRRGFYWYRRYVAASREVAQLRNKGVADDQNPALAMARRILGQES